ncbi:MAG: radical SAM protein [Candidatus Heimdallarchaeota archaeon]
MNYQYIHSTREHPTLGYTLYINLFDEKICTLDCLWCTMGRTEETVIERTDIFAIDDVMDEIKSFVEAIQKPDSIFFLNMGETTLSANLGKLIAKIKEEYPNIKVGLWTNGTLFYQKEVRDEFVNSDYITMDLCVTDEPGFKRLHRPHESLIFTDVLIGVLQFTKEFKGKLAISVTFLKGFNDTEENLEGLRKQLEEISPDEITVNFRKEKNAEPLNLEFVKTLREKWDGLDFKIALRELQL